MASTKENMTAEVHREEASSEPFAPVQQGVTIRMIVFSLYIALAGWVFNFDLGYGGTVLQMKSYRKSFGRCHMQADPTTGASIEVCMQTPLQQSLVSLTLIFVALGGASSGVLGNYYGRRGTIQSGALFAAAGAAGMLGTAGNFTNYMVCKCIGGIGLGQLIAAAPVYGAECTIASKRGMLLALYNIGLGSGNAVAAAACWGSSKYATNLAWQIPIICQIPLSFMIGFGVLLFPESPRWLLTKGRDEAAKRSFAWYYNRTPDDPVVLAQVQDVLNHMEMEEVNGKSVTWTDIYRGVNLRRTLVSGLIMIGLAITGSKFIGPYGAIFLAGAGIKNPFLNNFIIAMCSFAGTIPGPLVVEYGGRRFSMLCGYSVMTVCMLVIGIVGSVLGQNNSTARVVLLVFLFSWAFLFGVFIATSVWVASPEQHNIKLRTFGQASTTTIYQVFGFSASFYGPYMLSASYGNMGLNVAYFHAGVTFLMLILVFLLVPETAALTLEQIDEHYFAGTSAWKTSTRKNKRYNKGVESQHGHENGNVAVKS